MNDREIYRWCTSRPCYERDDNNSMQYINTSALSIHEYASFKKRDIRTMNYEEFETFAAEFRHYITVVIYEQKSFYW